MWTNFLGRVFNGSKPAVQASRPRQIMRGRPTLMRLEEREVMSSPASLAAPAMGAALVSQLAPQATNLINSVIHQASSIVPITVNSVTATTVNGVTSLIANASIGTTNFQIPLNLTVPSGQSATSATQILNLHVGEIHLDLLGLKVDTSEICLNITAQRGPGNLLGNLLAGVAGALDGGANLTSALGSLTTTQLTSVTSGLTNLLNGALGQLTSPVNAAKAATVTSAGTTNILHLSVGPLNLNLLGLQVNLDDCDGGPVTVDVSAESGPGNLLGNLLGGVSNLLNGRGHTNAVRHILNDVGNLIGGLI